MNPKDKNYNQYRKRVESTVIQELPFVQLVERLKLPSICGIYFLLSSNGEVLYIVQSLDIRRRWMSHHRFKEFAQIDEAKIAWLEYPYEKRLLKLEAAFIKKLNPTLHKGRTIGLENSEMSDMTLQKNFLS